MLLYPSYNNSISKLKSENDGNNSFRMKELNKTNKKSYTFSTSMCELRDTVNMKPSFDDI